MNEGYKDELLVLKNKNIIIYKNRYRTIGVNLPYRRNRYYVNIVSIKKMIFILYNLRKLTDCSILKTRHDGHKIIQKPQNKNEVIT